MSIQQKLATPLLLLTLSVGLAGCNTTPPKPVQPPLTEAQKAQKAIEDKGHTVLEDGISLYQNGYYSQAEAKFLSPDVWAAGDATRVQALKYLAFTYCVSERKVQCRQAFERALQINPAFTLDAAESSHPLWGPEFKIAKSTVK
ncbi:TssQ family T6SS-associated lipoprotein [Pseudomonas sp. RIT-PI-AD]|uniref:TssQ family T6SS-associated lipoprotein n=1 Tax=Pseudomonas sp. RIT-PI-AD TaxID=3035294 RepID=UPI0021DB271A|nr:TssQ family T6SS-associated lipoprotein [Pseudomonas sp. RIT-PI-AD]